MGRENAEAQRGKAASKRVLKRRRRKGAEENTLTVDRTRSVKCV
jgi:hypothetical protein